MADDPWAEFRVQAPAAQPLRLTVTPPSDAPAAADPWAEFRSAPASGGFVDAAKDIAKSAGVGYLKGAAGLVGAPADLAGLITSGFDKADQWVRGDTDEQAAARVAERNAGALIPQASMAKAGGKAIVNYMEDFNGPLHKPQSTAARYTERVGEFIPGAAIGPGGPIRNAVAFGAAPAVASEAAGDLTSGTSAEPYARAAAALAGGGIAGFATRPGAAGRSIRGALDDIPQADRAALFDQAEELFQEAHRRGIPLSRASAFDHVSHGASNLSNVQRVVEGSGGMRPFYAGTEQGVENAGRAAFDTIAPIPGNPSVIGPQVAEAAQQTIADTQAGINAATRPLYQAAGPQRVGPAVQGAFNADPLYAQTLQEIRNNPALNRTIEHLPDDAVGVQDLVQRRMREQAENARIPGQANSSNLAAANFEDARAPVIEAADTVTGSRAATATQPARVGTYEAARIGQANMRQAFLEPLMAGPIGKLAERPEVKGAIEALFPANPVPNSAPEVMRAVGSLAARNPWAARQIVRAHVESVFNEATQRLQSGPNQWGAAGFAAVLRGNRQQAENLAAGISALPNGPQILTGFDRFLDIMQATGMRQRIGSQTAFNTEEIARLKNAGFTEGALKIMAGGGIKLPQKILDTIERWRLGRNVDALANLFTNPEAGAAFRALATAPVGSRQAALAAGRLAAIGGRAANDAGARPTISDR